jgi:hypothetical protein
MTRLELAGAAAAFLILGAVTAVVQLRWLPSGRVKTVLVFLAGVSVIGSLRIAAIPPWWFAGEKAGFGIATWLLLWAFVSGDPPEAREFGRPLLTAMGLTVLALNVVAFVMARL